MAPVRGGAVDLGRWWEHPFMRELEDEARRDAALAKENDVHCKRHEQADWAADRELNTGAHVTPSQIGGLRQWFQSVDADDSGTVSLLELADPLLTTGVAESVSECVEIFQAIDEDGSGEVDFDEFLELVTIKSSGRLERMRAQWQRAAGEAPKIIDEKQRRAELEAAKADGILAICEALKNDETTMSLMSAITFERRKFISQAVMKKASRYRVRFRKAQFEAIREILFASPAEREAALRRRESNADGAQRRTSKPLRPRGPQLFTTRPLPWKEQNAANEEKGSQEEKSSKFDKSALQWPEKSSVLPCVQRRPILNRKRALVGLRARVTTPAIDDQEELFLALEQKRRNGPVDMVPSCVLQGSNTHLHRTASERAMMRIDMLKFPDWLRITASNDEEAIAIELANAQQGSIGG
ncbi:Calmodulin [Hondaea fermentalgiana]|uniref:Calmodulin n=1 Tax=Hondaea fermentalgiana TaxID=2315210 RepID=A0A2R5GXM8_9STRA|nr:Calmodulin [Hondaea fermentalgiana]|eukprot:GBG35079.1 Calmodulin [Hondaea fermentalgiana]